MQETNLTPNLYAPKFHLVGIKKGVNRMKSLTMNNTT